MGVIVFVISLLVTVITIPFIKNMLLSANIRERNYRGHMIPVSMGIALLPVIIINGIILSYFFRNDSDTLQLLLVFLVGTMTIMVVGLVDDLMGNREILGLKGHMKSLAKGALTTGGLKAIVGILTSLLISSFFSSSIPETAINTLVIALFTNLINLLDLRPGRAIKGFLLVSILFILIGLSNEVRIILGPFIAYAIAYLPQDIKAKSMMGDVGSNTLGTISGIVAVVSYTNTIKYVILSLLILIHIITEKYSLTEIIKNNSVLNFFDELGQ